ncbi:MAG: PKD repeat protein [Crocinitomicaceae bacterium]|jgi:PKD repeat protein
MKKLLFALLVVPFLGITHANAQACQADFVQDTTACPNVVFTDASTSIMPIVGWYWDFDDGYTSVAENPSHDFTLNGTYNICLTTITSDSCVSTTCQIINVNCNVGGGNPGCQADFSIDSSICPTISFLDQSSTINSVVSWYWTFGDGNTSTLQSPLHTYTFGGTYNLGLTIITSDSCTSTTSQVIDVNCIAGPPFCNALIAFDQDTVVCTDFLFTDASSSSSPAVSWFWNFDDGSTSTAQNPSHSYAANGSYTVTLSLGTYNTVLGDSCYSYDMQQVNVNCLAGSGPCQASFTSTSYIDSVGGTVLYVTNTSTSSSGSAFTNYFWDFGDGSTATGQYPTHVYTSDGTYILCLTVSDGFCTSTFCDTIVVTGSQNGFTLVTKSAASASVENLELISGVQLYPNPTNHNLTLNMESAEVTEIEVSIVNLAGQVVGYSTHQIGTGSNEIKLYTEELMKGYYFVKINSSISNIEAIRFIKN